MLDSWRYRNRDSGNVLTYASLGFLAGVVVALGIGGCAAGPVQQYPTTTAEECRR
jgi:hypothetical protein